MSAQVTNSRTKSRRTKKRDRPRSKSAPPSITITVRQKRKQWPGKAMMAAMDVVRSGELSLSRAAKVYDVPKSTLHYHVSGRVSHGHKSGPKPYLSASKGVALSGEVSLFSVSAGISTGDSGSTATAVVIGMSGKQSKSLPLVLSASGWISCNHCM